MVNSDDPVFYSVLRINKHSRWFIHMVKECVHFDKVLNSLSERCFSNLANDQIRITWALVKNSSQSDTHFIEELRDSFF